MIKVKRLVRVDWRVHPFNLLNLDLQFEFGGGSGYRFYLPVICLKTGSHYFSTVVVGLQILTNSCKIGKNLLPLHPDLTVWPSLKILQASVHVQADAFL